MKRHSTSFIEKCKLKQRKDTIFHLLDWQN